MPVATVNSIDVYYERAGTGPRLLFLNGSGSTLETSALLIRPAVTWPARVERLVLVCTTAGGDRAAPFPPRFLTLLAEAQTLDPAIALRRFVENSLAPGAPLELVEQIYRRRLERPPDPAGWEAQAAAATTYDGYDRVGAIGAPTLIVHGTEDNVVATENADILASLIPDARLELFHGCGHLFFWEQPERFVHVVKEFLR
jgi:pimeloyl-ACP methyl ester carboxylesterase